MRGDNSRKAFWQVEWTQRLMMTQIKTKSLISGQRIKENSFGFRMSGNALFQPKFSKMPESWLCKTSVPFIHTFYFSVSFL